MKNKLTLLVLISGYSIGYALMDDPEPIRQCKKTLTSLWEESSSLYRKTPLKKLLADVYEGKIHTTRVDLRTFCDQQCATVTFKTAFDGDDTITIEATIEYTEFSRCCINKDLGKLLLKAVLEHNKNWLSEKKRIYRWSTDSNVCYRYTFKISRAEYEKQNEHPWDQWGPI